MASGQSNLTTSRMHRLCAQIINRLQPVSISFKQFQHYTYRMPNFPPRSNVGTVSILHQALCMLLLSRHCVIHSQCVPRQVAVNCS